MLLGYLAVLLVYSHATFYWVEPACIYFEA